jgi:hypothetical protein
MRRISIWLPIVLFALGLDRAAAQPAPPPDEPDATAEPPPPAPLPPPPTTTTVVDQGDDADSDERPPAFIELSGNWGVNLGQTSYVPNGAPGSSRHPFATGFGGGAKVGIAIAPDWLSIWGSYRYGHTSTRTGELMGALSKVQGTLSYHALTVGLRLEHRAGPGNFYADFGLGLLLPFHTTTTVDYVPELAAIGITGRSTMEEDFGWALGAEGEMGYHVDLGTELYLGAGLHVSTFQADDAGRDTILQNFVTDFTARPPAAVTATIHHGTHGPETPTTYSVQDVRALFAVGYRF